jgi:FkbM family methyltransferase
MHNGDDTAFYLACGHRVLAVEADPDLVAAADKRFKREIESKQLLILNVGIAEHSTTAEFWINEVASHFNSFNRETSARIGQPHHSIWIQCRRLDEIISEYGVPFYLKIDIEGHDIVRCNQLAINSRPKYISVEMSQIALLLRLRDLGYDRFKLINQLGFHAVEPGNIKLHTHVLRALYRVANYRKDDRKLSLRIPRASAAKVLHVASALGLWGVSKPFRSRMLPEWNFASGSSGTFGEDLPGQWLTYDEIEYLWQRDLREHQKMKQDFWCDLHAMASENA